MVTGQGCKNQRERREDLRPQLQLSKALGPCEDL